MLTLIAWTLLAVNGLCLLLWLALATRVDVMVRRRPTVRAGLALPPPAAGWPRTSVIVPAHNEERVIDSCIGALREQAYDDLEIILVLDRCTDGTSDIATRHAAADDRVVVITNDSCPDDWAGKCHAARLGAEQATGDYLLFTDADTVFDHDLVRATVALAHDRELDLLSVLSTLTLDHAFEWVAQPIATMNLVQMYPIERVNRRGDARPFANGQFMLFKREAYEQIGGHDAVRDDLLEDIAFARAIQQHGGTGGLFLADGMLVCSMYDSLASFKAGWSRIFIEACKRKVRRLRKQARRLYGFGIAMPLAQLAGIGVGIAVLVTGHVGLGTSVLGLSIVTAMTQLLTLMRLYRFGGAPRRAAWLYPAGCWIVADILRCAASDLAARRPIRWAGKQYVLEPRD